MSYCPIYEKYPRHVAPDKGKRAIEKYIKRKMKETGKSLFEVHVYTMQKTVEFAIRQARAGTELRFIPHPATFYNRNGPDELELSWGPDAPKEEETPTGGPQSAIDPIWVRDNWHEITSMYKLPCPEPVVINNLPTLIRDLVEQAWEQRLAS